jgi:hypothetical protein
MKFFKLETLSYDLSKTEFVHSSFKADVGPALQEVYDIIANDSKGNKYNLKVSAEKYDEAGDATAKCTYTPVNKCLPHYTLFIDAKVGNNGLVIDSVVPVSGLVANSCKATVIGGPKSKGYYLPGKKREFHLYSPC